MTFGDFLRDQRQCLNETLRTFCKRTKYDTAYISRIENGLILAPIEADILKKLAFAYGIKKGEKKWERFFDLAAISRKTVPIDLVIENPNVVNYLPAFLRTAAKKNVTRKDVEELLKTIKEGK